MPREKIALGLTAPCVVTFLAALAANLGDWLDLPELAGIAALILALVGSLSVLFSLIGVIYLLFNLQTLRAFVQVACWTANLVWLAFCFLIWFPHSMHR